MQSNAPDLITPQSMLCFPVYKGSSAQLSSKHVPTSEFVSNSVGVVVGAPVGALVGAGGGEIVDIDSD